MNDAITLLLVAAGYIAVLMILSKIVSKGADNSTFFSGNRKMPWPLVAVAMICAPITGVTFVSVPGMVLHQGYAYLQMALGFIFGYMLIAWVLIPLFYKRNVISIYSFLDQRFGKSAYKTGAWCFLVSKILGTSVRFFVVCLALQLMIFDPLGLPFVATVFLIIGLIWLYTLKGGVKTVVWTDMFKSLCLIASVILCITFIATSLGLNFSELHSTVTSHHSFRMFFLDNPRESTYFWKQFVGGIFLVVAMTGLDQDMMQHPLSCKNVGAARKNMLISSVLQFVVIALFLLMGTLMAIYADRYGMETPEKSDNLFAAVAFHSELPAVVGLLFVLGLISASYSSVGSSLTSLTTSFTLDILGAHKKSSEQRLAAKRRITHTAMALAIIVVILALYYLSSENAINAVFTLASFTYGPILGIFIFGLYTRRHITSGWIAAVCIAAPALAWLTQWAASYYFDYRIGYELILFNAFYTFIGLYLISSHPKADPVTTA